MLIQDMNLWLRILIAVISLVVALFAGYPIALILGNIRYSVYPLWLDIAEALTLAAMVLVFGDIAFTFLFPCVVFGVH